MSWATKGTDTLVPDDPESGGNDWTLDGQQVWITVVNLSVLIKDTGEGVVVDIYPRFKEAGEVLATTYAFFQEAEDDDE